MPSKPRTRRQSTRLTGYDYTWPGAYFVTICTVDRACILDDAVLRRIVQRTWRTVVDRHASLDAGDFVVIWRPP